MNYGVLLFVLFSGTQANEILLRISVEGPKTAAAAPSSAPAAPAAPADPATGSAPQQDAPTYLDGLQAALRDVNFPQGDYYYTMPPLPPSYLAFLKQQQQLEMGANRPQTTRAPAAAPAAPAAQPAQQQMVPMVRLGPVPNGQNVPGMPDGMQPMGVIFLAPAPAPPAPAAAAAAPTTPPPPPPKAMMFERGTETQVQQQAGLRWTKWLPMMAE